MNSCNKDWWNIVFNIILNIVCSLPLSPTHRCPHLFHCPTHQSPHLSLSHTCTNAHISLSPTQMPTLHTDIHTHSSSQLLFRLHGHNLFKCTICHYTFIFKKRIISHFWIWWIKKKKFCVCVTKTGEKRIETRTVSTKKKEK